MQPVVISTTYGEREAMVTLEGAWETLGGLPCDGLSGYVEDLISFEMNKEYNLIIEKKAENLYRTISQKIKGLPSSSQAVSRTVGKLQTLELTPQESEQLSKYVSDDTYVKKQKEDIEELSQIFKEMMDRSDTKEGSQEFVGNIKNNFKPPKDEVKAVFEIRMTDSQKTLVIDVNNTQLKCYYGECEHPDVVATTTKAVINRLVNGRTTFQGAFMSGELTAKGDFKTLRMFDHLFQFDVL